ncbi:hypothetical protein ABPG72_001149 [Tetrahymena utriculariae]
MNEELAKSIAKAVMDALNNQKKNDEEDKIRSNQEQQIGRLSEKRTKAQKKGIAIHAVQLGNNVKAADLYGINEKTVRRYIAKYLNETEVKENQQKEQKYRPQQPGMEEKVVRWIEDQREKKKIINLKDIKQKAQEFKEKYDFKASNGWFQRFAKRNNLSLRTPTHVIQSCGSKVFEELQIFYEQIFDFRVKMAKQQKSILFINADETPLQINFKNKTYDFKGTKQISIKGIKNMRTRFTALLMVNSEGSVFPPLIIAKGNYKKKVINKFPDHCLIVQNDNSWITEDLYLLYLRSTLGNLTYDKNKQQICFIHDRCSSHLGVAVSKYLKSIGVQEFLIPAGATSLSQVLDVVVNKPVKSRIHSSFQKWVNNQENTSDSMLNPQVQDYTYFLLDSLNQLKKDSIINGWKTCGITNNLDGSENYLINKNITNQQELNQFLETLFHQSIQESDQDLLEHINSEQMVQTFEIAKDKENSLQDNRQNSNSTETFSNNQMEVEYTIDQLQADQKVNRDNSSLNDQKSVDNEEDQIVSDYEDEENIHVYSTLNIEIDSRINTPKVNINAFQDEYIYLYLFICNGLILVQIFKNIPFNQIYINSYLKKLKLNNKNKKRE